MLAHRLRRLAKIKPILGQGMCLLERSTDLYKVQGERCLQSLCQFLTNMADNKPHLVEKLTTKLYHEQGYPDQANSNSLHSYVPGNNLCSKCVANP